MSVSAIILAAASMATAVLDDPTGYGRIVRDENGDFVEIVEQSDATAEQREIREVFPSYYCLRSEELLLALSKLTNNNKKREYYLTDVYSILRKAGKKVLAVQAVTQEDSMAGNDRIQQRTGKHTSEIPSQSKLVCRLLL